MRKWSWLLTVLIFFSSLVFAGNKIIVLDINGAIGPATQDYIKRGISRAEEEHAAAIILQMNTPGGLETSMRGINESIINSNIPIITYVAPSGARAASAGVFILYASHLAAMASGTNVGAASPVNLLNPTTGKEMTTEEKKSVNDAAAYIRSLAELRGKNANWAEQAVRQAVSISANEAKRLKVIDEIAENFPELLQKLDNHKIIVHGSSQTLNTKGLQIENVAPDWRYQFLSFLTNPNVAYILMLIAMYGIFFELANPGGVLPGVVGLIAILLVLYAFQLMPINYAGLLLVLLGISFMLFEIYVSSFGVIGFGGITAFIIGSVMLFDTHDSYFQLTWSLILLMSLVSVVFFGMVLTLAWRSQKKAIVTGREGLVGNEGEVLSVMNEQVVVRVLGEIWAANSAHQLKPGAKVKVTSVHGLMLTVEPLKKR